MYSQVKTGVLQGLSSEVVTVETDLSPGLPAFTVVGLPDLSVREAKERIRTAILNSGYHFPAKRITINLAPAATKKEGTHFDLPIAMGVMISMGYIKEEKMKEYAFLGELSLDGSVNRINGALPLVMGLRKHGMKKVILPASNAKEASVIGDICLYPVTHLKEILEHMMTRNRIFPYENHQSAIEIQQNPETDFADVAGQETVKRALQIAAAASHNVLLIGPPGAGKTMMARRVPGILPSLTYEEKLEVTKIYSIAGELSEKKPLITERPFRSPHHTISAAALVGGGSHPKPGEVSLAHFGVLFLDELPEFNRSVLEMLRQPLEDEQVTISRVKGTVTYPSKIMLLASMNPCPCGFYGDPTHECTCSIQQIRQYLSKLSGPLLDRMDMHIEIMPVPYQDLSGCSDGDYRGGSGGDHTCFSGASVKDSGRMRLEVETARKIQLERYKNEEISYNSQLTARLMKKYCAMDKESKALLEIAYKKLSLSARAYHKIIRLARTIADMEEKQNIGQNHIAEAIQYRSLDKMFRGL